MTCCLTDVKPDAAADTEKRQGTFTYIVGTGKKALIFIPDIFGFHEYNLRIADMLADQGFLVVFPDFFEGEPWDVKDLPPKDPAKFAAFRTRLEYGLARPTVVKAVAIARSLGAESVGAVGFCWGGKIVITAMAEDLGITAGASPHPSRFTVEDGKAAKGPFCLLPSKDDTPLEEVRDALNTHPWAAKNAYHYFDDMHHGFCAARADFTNDLNVQRINEAIAILTKFFNETLA